MINDSKDRDNAYSLFLQEPYELAGHIPTINMRRADIESVYIDRYEYLIVPVSVRIGGSEFDVALIRRRYHGDRDILELARQRGVLVGVSLAEKNSDSSMKIRTKNMRFLYCIDCKNKDSEKIPQDTLDFIGSFRRDSFE